LGTISIFHWLIVLVFLGAPIGGLIFLGVWLSQRRK
jgi:hypothetical protein